MNSVTVDARGLACPLPVVNTKKATSEMVNGGIVTVLVDNEIAVQNLQKFAKQKGFDAKADKKAEKEFEVVITVAAENTAVNPIEEEEEILCATDSRQNGLVVALSAKVMGNGDDKLGASLMKAFVFALTKQDVLPETILCYNGGAFLTCEGADTLEDLKLLESEGVNILTCGTCMDFYGIKDKLGVGNVTNMYEIAEVMEKAKKVIKP